MRRIGSRGRGAVGLTLAAATGAGSAGDVATTEPAAGEVVLDPAIGDGLDRDGDVLVEVRPADPGQWQGMNLAAVRLMAKTK